MRSLALVLIVACSHGGRPASVAPEPAAAPPSGSAAATTPVVRASEPHRFEHAEEWAKKFDDPARDAWQKPDLVIAALELAPTMTVADVGAGTGYFTVRLARAVPHGQVIATDLEPDMIRYIGERAAREHLTNVRTALATATDPNLPAGSVDRILVADVWHHVADRVGYARGLAAALRPGGRIAIVDFTREATRIPAAHPRVAPEAAIAELRAAGLDASLSPTKLPDQYIVIGTRR
ncbi:MAG: class I SAM-dependent methyltransferase [Kofleriaceae bacterium]